MNQIYDPPRRRDFGLDFNYASWNESTTLKLCNVPWNNDYRDIVKFPNRAALNAYIDALPSDEPNMTATYAKPEQPVTLDVPFNRALRYNYLRARNAAQPTVIGGEDIARDFYYFVTSVTYVAPNTTRLTLQLDAWQTFGFEATFGNCYIDRGHIGIANVNAFSNYGRDFLTVPEGLETGGEYRVSYANYTDVMSYDKDVLVVSSVNLNADPGTVDDPKLQSATGGYFQNIPSGAGVYIFTTHAFVNFMDYFKEKPWITEGIISATLIPKMTRYFPDFVYKTRTLENPSGGTQIDSSVNTSNRHVFHNLATNWRNRVSTTIPARYRHLTKFLTFPYLAIELTMSQGTPVILKPESWKTVHARVWERYVLTPPGQRISIHPINYNSDTETDAEATLGSYTEWGDLLDVSTQMSNFPTIPIVNDGAISYLASNANSLVYQNQAASWAQQRALRGNETSYDQSSRGMETTNELASIGRNTDSAMTGLTNQTAQQQAMLNAATGVVGGAAGGLVAGPGGAAVGAVTGAGGAVAGLIGTGIQTSANNQALALRNAQSQQATGAQLGQAGYVRDTNRNLADWAARGDYENTIAGLNARTQDAMLTQPSISGQMGGEAGNVIWNTAGVMIKFKLIDNAAIRTVGEYWLRYGYAVRMFAKLPASLMVMSKFTYWKLSETYVQGNMPEPFKQAIRGIFEKGVTVWANPADIGNIDIADNTPLEGVVL